VGRIGRPHGLDGSAYVNGHGGAVPLDPGTSVRVGEREAVITARKGSPQRPIVRFDIAASREAIEELRGRELTVDADLLPSPEEDEFLHVDLIGCSVLAGDVRLGEVVAVHEYPANDVLELSGGEMLPFVDEVIEHVDVPGRTIRIQPGFLDA
jgi:16S rRNA processing protein RimM